MSNNKDQLVTMMANVNEAIRVDELNTNVVNQIFSICSQLKTLGQQLEATNKNDLNNFFVSLRQACCRDNGQLGTPCRLKIMEMIELRAMNWKTSLAHTQYYLNRAEGGGSGASKTTTVAGESPPQSAFAPPPPPLRTVASSSPPASTFAITRPSRAGSSLSASAAPFIPAAAAAAAAAATSTTVVPRYMPPTPATATTTSAAAASSTPFFVPPDLSAAAAGGGGGGFILIPTQSNWSQQLSSLMSGAAAAGAPQLRGVSTPPASQQQQQQAMAAAAAAAAAATTPEWLARSFGGNPMAQAAFATLTGNVLGTGIGGGNMLGAKSALKTPQLREEVTIKNSDSGKIMGVRGRRVALIEEMSKTIISFQKAEPTMRYRTLAITGSTADSIVYAKQLIDETIKRNTSPNRFDSTNDSQSTLFGQQRSNFIGGTMSGAASTVGGDDDEDDDDEMSGISIQTAQDGTLKVSCEDPEMLAAAQQALTEYLTLRQSRMTLEERAERKERRKSMPLQSSSAGVSSGDLSTVSATPRSGIIASGQPRFVASSTDGIISSSSGVVGTLRAKRLGSTPNLVALEGATASAIPSLFSSAISPGIGSGPVGGPFLASSPTPAVELRAYGRETMLEIRDTLSRDTPSTIKLSGDADAIAELTTKQPTTIDTTSDDERPTKTITTTAEHASGGGEESGDNLVTTTSAAEAETDKKEEKAQNNDEQSTAAI